MPKYFFLFCTIFFLYTSNCFAIKLELKESPSIFESFVHLNFFTDIKQVSQTAGKITSRNVEPYQILTPENLLFTVDSESLKRELEKLLIQENSLILEMDFLQKSLARRKENPAAWPVESIDEYELKSKQASLNLKSLKTTIAETKYQLTLKNIYPDFLGQILSVYVQQGEWVLPGTPLFRLVSPYDFRITARLPKHIFLALEKNTPTVLSSGERVFFPDSYTQIDEKSGLVLLEGRMKSKKHFAGETILCKFPILASKIIVPKHLVRHIGGFFQICRLFGGNFSWVSVEGNWDSLGFSLANPNHYDGWILEECK